MLCVPIQAATVNEVIIQMQLAQNEADLFEIWLDHLLDKNIFKIIKAKTKPLIFVNKPIRERGKFTGSEASRIELLKQAIELGADYIDISLDTNKELIQNLLAANRNRAKIILSYHNFRSTPETEDLIKLAKKAYKFGASIVKIATQANKYQDNLKIFSLVFYFVSHQKNIIGLCLGEQGKISRVMTPLLGSYLMYAPMEVNGKSAAGQLTIRELKDLWGRLK